MNVGFPLRLELHNSLISFFAFEMKTKQKNLIAIFKIQDWPT